MTMKTKREILKLPYNRVALNDEITGKPLKLAGLLPITTRILSVELLEKTRSKKLVLIVRT